MASALCRWFAIERCRATRKGELLCKWELKKNFSIEACFMSRPEKFFCHSQEPRTQIQDTKLVCTGFVRKKSFRLRNFKISHELRCVWGERENKMSNDAIDTIRACASNDLHICVLNRTVSNTKKNNLTSQFQISTSSTAFQKSIN